jgi:signal transduction histidine kinase
MLKLAHLTRESVQRLTEMVHEVKGFTQFQQQEFAKQFLSVAEVVHELVSFLRFDKSVPFQQILTAAHTDPVVLGHKVKLQQVLLNLIKNAAYAIRGKTDGKIVVTVTSDDNDAILQVADNGCGMPPNVQSRIWEPFFTTKGKEGTGLGMDICRKLVVSHGGTVSFTSAPGKGTTFEIRLPLAPTK